MPLSPVEQSIISFVQHRSCGKEPVSLNTLVFNDLQIDGLDALTFMNDFFKSFDVAVAGYNHQHYAFNEADLTNIFKTLWSAIFNRRHLQKTSFPVHHLVAVAEQGHWFEYIKA
jgi:hypothetical protein